MAFSDTPNRLEAVFIQRDTSNSRYDQINISGSDLIVYLDSTGKINADKIGVWAAIYGIGSGSSSSGSGTSVSSSWASSSFTSYFATQSLFSTQSLFATQSRFATQSLFSTQSLFTTQSLFSTQSLFATQSISSSYAVTSSFSISASFSPGSISSSYSLSSSHAESASYALTSSYALTASQAIVSVSASYFSGSQITASSILVGLILPLSSSIGNPTMSFTTVYATQLFGTASWATQSFSASVAQTASLADAISFVPQVALSASWASASLSSSYSLSASNAISASYTLSASNTISSSYALSASNALDSVSASYSLSASNALSASFAPSSPSISSSYALSSSYAGTASVILGTITSASYALSSSNALSSSYALSASYAISSSYSLSSSNAVSSSYSLSSSFALISISASYALSASYSLSASNAISASYSLSASYALSASKALSASYALSSSGAISSSYSFSSSYSGTASFAFNAKPNFIYSNVRAIMLCAGFIPNSTGADSAEIPIPYSGSTPVTWSINRFNWRVQSSGSQTSSVTFEKYSGTGSFVGTTLATMLLNSSSYETFTASAETLVSGDKIRFNVNDIGDATNWTLTTEIYNDTDILTGSLKKVVVLCSAFVPGNDGPDTVEIPIPYGPNGYTPLVWGINRLNFRVQLSGSTTSSVMFEKSTGSGIFSASLLGMVSLNSSSYETYTISSASVNSGEKIRFNIVNAGSAQFWTLTAEMGSVL